MADGDQTIIQQADVRGPYGKSVTLLDNIPVAKAVSGTYKGPWRDISTLKAGTVQVDGTSLTGTVNIEGTNVSNPVDATDGYALCTALTASGLSQLTKMPVKYIRATVTGFTVGSVSARFHGVA